MPNEITIYRDTFELAIIKPLDSSTMVKKIMGDHALNISFEDSRNIVFYINDWCTVYGETYRLNKLPVITKLADNMFKYSLTLEAEAFDLSKVLYLFLGSDNSLREVNFSLTETAAGFMDLLMKNIARIYTGWTLGEVIPTGTKTLTFNNQSCYNAIAAIAEAFETEFWIEGKRITLAKKGNDTGHTFRQGKYSGLYEITRQNVDSTGIVTRLYAFGSDKNLPPLYSSELLHMPGKNPGIIQNVTVDAADAGSGNTTYTFHFIEPLATDVTTLSIEYKLAGTTTWTNNTGSHLSPRFITVPSGTYDVRFRTYGGVYHNSVTDIITVSGPITTAVLPNNYLAYVEKNTNIYGIVEGVMTFPDVYPHRTGKVTSADATNIYRFGDALMDFDVMTHLSQGLERKITFNTGQLAGYTFKIASFDYSTKLFTILKNAEETALDIPSDLIKPAIGDEYVLHDIEMPQSYVDAAEVELQAKALAALDELSIPQVSYTGDFDPAYLKARGITLNIGDMVWIKDEQLGLERRIRVTQITRGIIQEYDFKIEMADVVQKGFRDTIVSGQAATSQGLTNLGNSLQNNAVFNNRIIGTLTFEQMPTTNSLSGHSYIVINNTDNKLYRLI